MTEIPGGSRRYPFLWYVMTAGAVALILGWGAAEKGPPRWDDSWYLAAAVRLFDRFADEGIAGYWRGFQHALGDKAPLITVLPFPFFCLIGRSTYVVYLVNSAACAVLAASLYLLARRFFEERAALLAVFFTLTAPLMAGLSRLFLAEYWLSALVAASLWALSEWEATGRSRWMLAAGALSGLGLLMKITFPVFVAPPAAVILLRARGKRPLRLAANAALAAAPLALVAGPWYWHNWERVAQRSFRETYFAPVHPTEPQSRLRLGLDYLAALLNEGVSAVHVAAAAAGLGAWALGRRDNVMRGAAWYVAPWASGLPVFAVSENRDLRLIAPLIPAAALATAALFDRFLGRVGRWRRPAIAATVAAGTALTAGQAFGWLAGYCIQIGRWRLLAEQTGYAFAPNPHSWPLEELLAGIAHRERLGRGSRLIVGLGADTWSLNSNNLELAAALARYPIEFYTTAYTSSRDQVRNIMSRTQYFLLKEGGTQQPVSRFAGGPMTEQFLREGPLFREVPELAVALPDGGRVRVFHNASAGPDVFWKAHQREPAPDLPAVEVNFGNELQLKGLRLTERDGIFTLALRWRCLNRPQAPYRAFAHLVDAEGKIAGTLDHEILSGSPPVDHWQPGDEGYEARYLALPAARAHGVQLRLGLFDPETGLRTPVWASTLPLKDDYTAAVAEANREPGRDYVFRLGPGPLADCSVVFANGLRLTGYSLRRSGGTAWLRLRWMAPAGERRRLHFFGHAVPSLERGAPILLGFDQDLGLDRRPRPRRSGPFELTLDVVRDVSRLGAEVKFLRAGVFDLDDPRDRLAIESSTLPMSREQKAIFLPY